jgi:hypothetical protein
MVHIPFLRGRRRAARQPRHAPTSAPGHSTRHSPADQVRDVTYVGRRLGVGVDDWMALGFSAPHAQRLTRLSPQLTGLPPAGRPIVTVITPGGAGPLRHYPFHGPRRDWFEWGYDGSAPRDLARAILLDLFQVTPTARGGYYPPQPGELPVDYRTFHREVICALTPGEPWALTSQQLAEWIEAQQ